MFSDKAEHLIIHLISFCCPSSGKPNYDYDLMTKINTDLTELLQLIIAFMDISVITVVARNHILIF